MDAHSLLVMGITVGSFISGPAPRMAQVGRYADVRPAICIGEEMSDFGGYQYPKARKAHRCAWCGEEIPKDEKYTRYVGMWEDEFQNWAMHTECFADSDNEDTTDGFTLYDHARPAKVTA